MRSVAQYDFCVSAHPAHVAIVMQQEKASIPADHSVIVHQGHSVSVFRNQCLPTLLRPTQSRTNNNIFHRNACLFHFHTQLKGTSDKQ